MRVRASIVIDGRISDAERLWFDTARWPSFVDGFHHVHRADPGWPAEGTIAWDSVPGGRGRVLETVLRYEARIGQSARVEDQLSEGTQTVSFAALPDGGVRMTLELDWQLKVRRLGPLADLVNLVFVRPRQREALYSTLVRFRRELADEAEPDRLVGQ